MDAQDYVEHFQSMPSTCRVDLFQKYPFIGHYKKGIIYILEMRNEGKVFYEVYQVQQDSWEHGEHQHIYWFCLIVHNTPLNAWVPGHNVLTPEDMKTRCSKSLHCIRWDGSNSSSGSMEEEVKFN